jgi:hypothetical protein
LNLDLSFLFIAEYFLNLLLLMSYCFLEGFDFGGADFLEFGIFGIFGE